MRKIIPYFILLLLVFVAGASLYVTILLGLKTIDMVKMGIQKKQNIENQCKREGTEFMEKYDEDGRGMGYICFSGDVRLRETGIRR